MNTPFSAILRSILLLAFWLLASSSYAFQEKLILKHVSRDIGLPTMTARAIMQDRDGVMWIGIQGGLLKFNGSEVVTYAHDPLNPKSLSNHFVNALLQDRSGMIWVATMSGLNRFDPNTETFELISSSAIEGITSLEESIINDILEDQHGNIWVATQSGVARAEAGSSVFSNVLKVESDSGMDPMRECKELYQDSNDNIWMATRSGIFRYNSRIDRIEAPAEIDFGERSIRSMEFFDIVEDDYGRIWFGHQTGLGYFDKRTQRYQETEGVTSVHSLLKDGRGFVWVGGTTDGLRIIDPKTLETRLYRHDPLNPEGLLSNSIRCLYEDRNGLVWIGTKFEGVFFYDKNVETFPLWTGSRDGSEGMRGTHVLSVLEDEGGTVWIGTRSNGLNSLERETNQFTSYYAKGNSPNTLNARRIEAIHQSRDGMLWLGTEKGLARLDPRSRRFQIFNTYIVRRIHEVSDDELYIGTNFGIQIFDRSSNSFKPFPVIDGIDLSDKSAIEIKVLHEGEQGVLYIGTHHSGLYTYHAASNTLKAYRPSMDSKNSISGDMIRSILPGNSGEVWIGTRLEGLNRFDPKTEIFTHYKLKDGLPSEAIQGITEDRDGVLWLATDEGFCRFDPSTLSAMTYTVAYGLQSNIFSPNALYQSQSGEIFVGGDGGFNIFHPKDIEEEPYQSDLIFSSAYVFEEKIHPDRMKSGSITLPYDQNYITLSFALTDYRAPNQNEFSYMLEGMDEEWIYSKRRNYATYTSMDPGEYRFLVRGKNPSAEWSDEYMALDITILPPFWETPLFIGGSLLVLVGFTIGGYQYLNRRNRMHQLELERTVDRRTFELRDANMVLKKQSRHIRLQKDELEEHKTNLEEMVRKRTRELEKEKIKAEESDRLKTSFLANMSHEIRTPMNAIIGFSSIISDSTDEERDEFVKLIDSNCNSLTNLIDDILDISKIEAGELAVEKRPFDLHQLIRELSIGFQGQVDRNGAKNVKLLLTESIDDEPFVIGSDPERLKQILNNLIGNALKFTENGHVSLSYRLNRPKREIEFEVEDTGIGIEKKDLDVIWDRFRKIEDNKSQLYRGTGLGLSITKNLVQLLGGSISVESEPNAKTVFKFHITYFEPSSMEVPKPIIVERDRQNSRASRSDCTPVVLVAEDEDSNFLLLSKFLKDEPCQIVRARNGREAVEFCQEHEESIGLIFMDIKMPVLNGCDASKEIKEVYPRIPIIAHTAYATTDERREIMKHGFDGYISKPIARKKIEDILDKHLVWLKEGTSRKVENRLG